MITLLLTSAFFLAIEWCRYEFRARGSLLTRDEYDRSVITHLMLRAISSLITIPLSLCFATSPLYHEFLIGCYMYLVLSLFAMEYRFVYYNSDYSWVGLLASSYFLFMAMMHESHLLIVLTPLLDAISIPFYFHWTYRGKYSRAKRALWRTILLYVYGATIILNIYLSVVAFQSIYPSYIIYVYMPLFLSNLVMMCHYW